MFAVDQCAWLGSLFLSVIFFEERKWNDGITRDDKKCFQSTFSGGLPSKSGVKKPLIQYCPLKRFDINEIGQVRKLVSGGESAAFNLLFKEINDVIEITEVVVGHQSRKWKFQNIWYGVPFIFK